jgi:tripartite-type tricarboxylate transporter receptor subunit TctC
MARVWAIGTVLSSAFAMCFSLTASAQDYPVKPIRIYCAGIGGGGDFVSRLISQGISGSLGQQMLVENRGLAGAELVAKAPPDGYSLLVYGNTIFVQPFLQAKVPYDVKDFVPISMVDRSPLLLVIHPSLPVKSVKELVALAKAQPSALNYSTGTQGATSHLAGELFKSMAGVQIVNIPYKSGAQEITDLIAGQVQLTFSTGAAAPHVKSGKLRAVAVTGAQPSPLYPGVPTIAATGVPGYQMDSFTGLYARVKTPDAILRRLNQEIVRFMSTAEAKDRLFNAGAEAVSTTPEELAAAVDAYVAKAGKLIRDLGIRAD